MNQKTALDIIAQDILDNSRPNAIKLPLKQFSSPQITTKLILYKLEHNDILELESGISLRPHPSTEIVQTLRSNTMTS